MVSTSPKSFEIQDIPEDNLRLFFCSCFPKQSASSTFSWLAKILKWTIANDDTLIGISQNKVKLHTAKLLICFYVLHEQNILHELHFFFARVWYHSTRFSIILQCYVCISYIPKSVLPVPTCTMNPLGITSTHQFSTGSESTFRNEKKTPIALHVTLLAGE